MTRRRRSGGTARPTRREVSAGGVVVRVEAGRPLYLIIRDRHGNWGFPKGHVEASEQPETAAAREVAEETGLDALRVRAALEPIQWTFTWRGALIRKTCHYFLMETSAEATRPQTAEGITACRWSSLDDALKLIPWENARRVLRAADGIVTRAAASPLPTAARGVAQ